MWLNGVLQRGTSTVLQTLPCSAFLLSLNSLASLISVHCCYMSPLSNTTAAIQIKYRHHGIWTWSCASVSFGCGQRHNLYTQVWYVLRCSQMEAKVTGRACRKVHQANRSQWVSIRGSIRGKGKRSDSALHSEHWRGGGGRQRGNWTTTFYETVKGKVISDLCVCSAKITPR